MPPTSADDAFASLMAAEETFKKDFKARSAGTSLSSQQTSVKRLPSVKTVSDHELRRLGLPGAEQQQHPARRAPPPPPAPPPMPAPVLAPAPAPAPAAAVPDRLATVLAARKAQVSVAKHTELLGLRSAGEVDSDDDDDGAVCDAPGSSGAAAPGAASGKTEASARDVNLLASDVVGDRQSALARLTAAALPPEALKPLLQPLLLRFADASEKCRDGAIALVTRWASASDAPDVSGALPFLIPVMVERLGLEKTTEPSEEIRAALVSLMRDVLLLCRALIRPYIAEVGAIALGCCRDDHPDVIKALCQLLKVAAAEVLRPICEAPPPPPTLPPS